MTTSMAVFDKVAVGEMTPEEGARQLMVQRRSSSPRKPTWMPRWAFILCVFAVAFLLAPVLRNGERHQ